MVASETELLAAIAAAPADDAPRLVYADFLLDRGDPRGELVVAQCALERIETTDGPRGEARALRERVRSLIALHRPTWLEPILDVMVGDFELRRGFVEHVTLFVPSLDEATQPRLRDAAPLLRSIAATGPDCIAQAFAASEIFALDELVLSGPGSVAAIRESLGACAELRRLELRRLGEVPSARDLAVLPAGLAHLAFEVAGSRELFPIAALAPRGDLRSLALRNVRIAELAVLDRLPALVALELVGGLPDLHMPELPRLTSLALAHAAVDPLAMLKTLPGLTRLRATHAGITDREAIALAASPLAASLRRLDLSDNKIGEAGMRALVESPHFDNLVDLRLANNPGRGVLAGALAERVDCVL